MRDHFQLMADYNRWMNGNLHRAAAALPADALDAPRGAFFGSILGTLNHLVVADTVWLKRFGGEGRDAYWTALQAVAAGSWMRSSSNGSGSSRTPTWTRSCSTGTCAATCSGGGSRTCCCTCSTTRPTTAARPPRCSASAGWTSA